MSILHVAVRQYSLQLDMWKCIFEVVSKNVLKKDKT